MIYFLLLSVILTFCVVIANKVETNAQMPEVTEITTEATTEQISTVEETSEIQKTEVFTTEKPTIRYTEPKTTEVELTTVKYEDIPKFRELGRFYITGYTPTCTHCCGKSNGIGASGKKVVVGEGVAMNRTDMKKFGLEYGDKIYIEGIGERVIVDTGCGQGVVDVACDSHQSCNDITGYYRVKVVL